MGKRGRSLERSERAEKIVSHSEVQAVQITDDEVGKGFQGGEKSPYLSLAPIF